MLSVILKIFCIVNEHDIFIFLIKMNIRLILKDFSCYL